MRDSTLGHVRSAMIIEDNAVLREALVVAVRSLLGCPTLGVASVAETKEYLETVQPDLVLLDVELTDGTAFDVLALLAQAPTAPTVVGMSGVAGPEEAFRLAQLGLRRFLKKPIALNDIECVLRGALSECPDLKPLVRASVGHAPLHEVEELVRATMLGEALARSDGNRRGAARILKVSRQLLQHMLRRGSP